MKAPYVAPLWPAGHLPHKGGDWLSSAAAPILRPWRLAATKRQSDLPPCGGDGRQARGGREEMRRLASIPLVFVAHQMERLGRDALEFAPAHQRFFSAVR